MQLVGRFGGPADAQSPGVWEGGGEACVWLLRLAKSKVAAHGRRELDVPAELLLCWRTLLQPLAKDGPDAGPRHTVSAIIYQNMYSLFFNRRCSQNSLH